MIHSHISLDPLFLGNSNVLPEVSPFTGTNLHVISENVSNPSIGFSANSISALSIDGM